MNKKIENWIALRYFFSKKKTGLISFTSYFSIFGIAIGTFALVVTLSILNGFETEIISRVIDLESHIKITGNNIVNIDIENVRDALKSEDVKSIKPFVSGKSILTSNTNEEVVRIFGIDSLSIQKKLSRNGAIIRGSHKLYSPISNLPGIILGYRLADKLGLYIGDTVNVINPLKIGGTMNIPIVGKFVCSGFFKLDLFDYDDKVVFIKINQAQKIFRKNDSYTGINVTFNEFEERKFLKEKIVTKLGKDRNVATWSELHRSLFGAMKLEKYGSFIALCLIILVAIFNLMSSLVMLVIEKIKEVGMLQALGMNRIQVRKIFLYLGMITGFLGLCIGLLFSLSLCLIQQHFHIIPLPSVYFIPYLPVEVQFLDVFGVIFASVIFIFGGTFYPSWRVSKLMVLDAIQYEK